MSDWRLDDAEVLLEALDGESDEVLDLVADWVAAKLLVDPRAAANGSTPAGGIYLYHVIVPGTQVIVTYGVTEVLDQRWVTIVRANHP